MWSATVGPWRNKKIMTCRERRRQAQMRSPTISTWDMHVEFKKSSLPNKAKKPKIQFIPFRLLQENNKALCEKILKLEQEIDNLREQNSILKRKLRKKPTSLTTPSLPPLKKES